MSTVQFFKALTLGLVLALPGVCEEPKGKKPEGGPSDRNAGFFPLFNGKDLDGWDGNMDVWKVERDTIVGSTEGLKHNEFLATKHSFHDFVLKIQFRLANDYGNSGVQFRSERIEGQSEMIGYQADIGEKFWGCLYDESRRNKVLVQPKVASLEGVIRRDGWNDYMIRCMGNRIEMFLNGVGVVDYRETDSSIATSGRIGLQVHSAPKPVRVEFKDILIQLLPVASAEAPRGFVRRTFKGTDGIERKYCVFLPAEFGKDATKKWPTILFLHGAGERGEDGDLPIKVGLGPAILRHGENFPFIAIFPQARKSWGADSADLKAAVELFQHSLATMPLDPDRIHLSGLSMGGAGALELAVAMPQSWATVSALCTRVDPQKAEILRKLPVQLFCGGRDATPTVVTMRGLAFRLRELAGDVHYTEFPELGHNCWDATYGTKELYDWMESHQRLPLP